MQEMVIYGVSFDMVGKQPIVLLKTIESNKFLPIWIGHPEAAAILIKLQGASTPRPMTHDLLSDMLGELEVECTRVSVTELRENTFYASISLRANGREIEIDSRPSDALALAVRSGAPIFAADEVIAESAIEFEHEVEDTEEVVEKFKDFLDNVKPDDFADELIDRGGRSGTGALYRADADARIRRDQLVELDSGGLGGLRQQARLGQARDHVDLQHEQLAVADRASGRRGRSSSSRAASRRRRRSRSPRVVVSAGRSAGHSKARTADLVPGLEVVELLIRERLDDRQGDGAVRPRRASRRRARARRRVARAGPCGRRRRRRQARPAAPAGCAANLIPSADPWRRRLDDDREAEPGLDRGQRLRRRRAPGTPSR